MICMFEAIHDADVFEIFQKMCFEIDVLKYRYVINFRKIYHRRKMSLYLLICKRQ